jgi:chromate transporter
MRTRLVEIAKVFLRLGATAFGGPAAHIALMHQEFVQRRKWVSEQHFLDMVGATNLIPGPNSTEMAIHLGYVRARTPGLLLAGACFVGPAMVIVTALAWAYVRFGTTPAFVWLLYGVKPVIIAIILGALYSLGKTAVKGLWTGAALLVVLALYESCQKTPGF